jgi:hypothetical protein
LPKTPVNVLKVILRSSMWRLILDKTDRSVVNDRRRYYKVQICGHTTVNVLTKDSKEAIGERCIGS